MAQSEGMPEAVVEAIVAAILTNAVIHSSMTTIKSVVEHYADILQELRQAGGAINPSLSRQHRSAHSEDGVVVWAFTRAKVSSVVEPRGRAVPCDDFDKERHQVSAIAIEAIQDALKRAGVEFIDENGGDAGVRLRRRTSKWNK